VRLGLILASVYVVDGFLEHGSRVRPNTSAESADERT